MKSTVSNGLFASPNNIPRVAGVCLPICRSKCTRKQRDWVLEGVGKVQCTWKTLRATALARFQLCNCVVGRLKQRIGKRSNSVHAKIQFCLKSELLYDGAYYYISLSM